MDDGDGTPGEGSIFPHTAIAVDNVETIAFALLDDVLLTALTDIESADLSDTRNILVAGDETADAVFGDTVADASGTVVDARELGGRLFFDGSGSANTVTVMSGLAGGDLLGTTTASSLDAGDTLVGGPSDEAITGAGGIDRLTGGGGRTSSSSTAATPTPSPSPGAPSPSRISRSGSTGSAPT